MLDVFSVIIVILLMILQKLLGFHFGFFFPHQHYVLDQEEVGGRLEVMIPQHGRPLAEQLTVSGGGSIPNGPHYGPLFFMRNPAGKSITVNHRQYSAPRKADGRETTHAATEDFWRN